MPMRTDLCMVAVVFVVGMQVGAVWFYSWYHTALTCQHKLCLQGNELERLASLESGAKAQNVLLLELLARGSFDVLRDRPNAPPELPPLDERTPEALVRAVHQRLDKKLSLVSHKHAEFGLMNAMMPSRDKKVNRPERMDDFVAATKPKLWSVPVREVRGGGYINATHHVIARLRILPGGRGGGGDSGGGAEMWRREITLQPSSYSRRYETPPLSLGCMLERAPFALRGS